MKIRDTALANDGRVAAGLWLKTLRETRGLSQSELAAALGEPHYTLISQLETGRRSIPTYHIMNLSEALGVDPSDFARTLLCHQDPFTHACLFGTRADFDSAVQRALFEKPETDTGLDQAILALAGTTRAGEPAGELQRRVEERIGRKLHYQSLAQALRRLENAGLMRRVDKNWTRTRKRA